MKLKTSKIESFGEKKIQIGFDTSINKKKSKTNEKKFIEVITKSNANSDAAAVEKDESEKNGLKNE